VAGLPDRSTERRVFQAQAPDFGARACQVPSRRPASPSTASTRAAKVGLAVAAPDRGGEDRAGARGRLEGHPGALGLVQAQDHVLEHVRGLEEGGEVVLSHAFRLEGEHRRSPRSGAHDLLEHVEVGARGVGHQEGLGERDGVGGGHRVVDELEQLALAQRAGVDHPARP